MKLLGSSAIDAEVVTDELREAAFAGRAAFVWCDGQDVTAIVGESGDSADQVLKLARRVVGEFA